MMTNQEKIAMLEDTFDMKKGTLTEATELSGLKRWDSMTKLSLIVLMDDEFNKTLKPAQIKNFVTIQDILDFMS